MLKKIEALNKRIASLNTEKTKADAQRGVWEKRLLEGLEAYNNKYFTNLPCSGVKAIRKELARELNEVERKTTEEYNKSLEVVLALEKGDIEKAYKLLGMEVYSDEDEEVAVDSSEVEGVCENPTIEDGVKLQSVNSVVEELEDSDFMGSSVKSTDSILNSNKSKPTGSEMSNIYSDDLVLPAVNLSKTGSKPAVSRSKVFIVEEDDDDEVVVPVNRAKPVVGDGTGNKGNLYIEEDDEEDLDPYGGFSSILKGSAFKVD